MCADDLKGAVLIFGSDDLDHVAACLHTIPAVQRRLFGCELIPLGPLLPWETLFTGTEPKA